MSFQVLTTLIAKSSFTIAVNASSYCVKQPEHLSSKSLCNPALHSASFFLSLLLTLKNDYGQKVRPLSGYGLIMRKRNEVEAKNRQGK